MWRTVKAAEAIRNRNNMAEHIAALEASVFERWMLLEQEARTRTSNLAAARDTQASRIMAKMTKTDVVPSVESGIAAANAPESTFARAFNANADDIDGESIHTFGEMPEHDSPFFTEARAFDIPKRHSIFDRLPLRSQ